MLLSDEKKFIYVHIPKTAGTSVRAALDDYKTYTSWRLIDWLADRVISIDRYRKFPMHSTAFEIREIMGRESFNDYYKFAFVRNPWELEVSTYHYMRKDRKHPLHKLVSTFNGFDDFIKWRINGGVGRVQKDFVVDQDGEVIVDFIGRFESLKDDFRKVCHKLDIDADLPHANKSQHEIYHEYYTEWSRDAVHELFRDDIEFFEYKY